ncbi:hypothetical protein EC973_008517, partial [Apophysomyces ossiformis]
MFNDAENDQQLLNILGKVELAIKESKQVSVADIKLPTLVVPKGRPKGALGSRLPSSCEIAKAEKKSDKEVNRDVFILSNKRKSVDQEIDDFPTKRSHAGMPYERVDDADFVVDENIPRDNYINTVDVRGDGYCKFRVLALLLKGDEDEFPSVKKQMLQQLDSNTEIYRNYYNYPVEQLRKIVEYGHKLDKPSKNAPSPGCGYEYWFDSSICVQLACDTFNVPIAVFSDAGKRAVTTDEGEEMVDIHPPVLHLPYNGPIDQKKPPSPLVMHFVHGNHWATVVMKRSRKMVWPPIYYKHKEVCAKLGLDDK